MREKIKQILNEKKEECIAFLQKTVREPSILGSEKKVQHLVADYLNHIGMDVDFYIPEGDEWIKHPYFCATRIDFKESPNVIGIWKGQGQGSGKSIVLNGHIDVVPEGDHNQWSMDPYSGIIKDGKLYGRGATDMKGGNAASLLAIHTLKAAGYSPLGDIIFHSVIEEESGGAGTLSAILKGYTADAALIPEPTNMKIFPSQQGSMWFRITVKGKQAHGGTRYEGISAIDKAFLVIHSLHELETSRNSRISDPLYKNIPIPVPINVGKITGGNWPSSVPDTVIIEGRIGVAPHETLEEVKRELESEMTNLNDSWLSDHPPTVEWFGAQWLPGSISLDHPLLNTLQKRYSEVIGAHPVIEASPWGTDGGLLTTVGNTPSIVFGPGVTSVAHYPDEYIELERIYETAEIMALTIMDWCGGDMK